MSSAKPQPAPPPRDTVIAALKRAAGTVADKVFLNIDGDSYTYAEVDSMSTSLSYVFAARGVREGDTVVSFLDTGLDPLLCWFALNKLGALWVPINTSFAGDFLRHQVCDSEARLVICEDHYLERFREIGNDIPKVELVLVRGSMAPSESLPYDVLPFDRDEICEKVDAAVTIAPQDLSCLIYTSGTTGPSKGCMISHNFLCSVARQQNVSVDFQSNDVVWTCLPLFHIGSIGVAIMGALLAQGSVYLSPRFSVSEFWTEIETSNATLALLVATMFPFIAQAPDNESMKRCQGQLRAIFGIPVAAATRQIWIERFGVQNVVSFSYGQTEVCKVCNYKIGDPLPPLESCGPIADEFIVDIFDDEDRPVPIGECGEIVVRPRYPDIMFSGYWKRPDDTAYAWRNLWMHTGDIGRMDEQGNLYFVDRKKDYLRRRGENVSSFEVESAFMRHPAVAAAALYGVVSPDSPEEEIKLSVMLREDVSVTPAELRQWAAERIPYFALPRFIEFHADFPRTPTGKIQKFALRAMGKGEAAWDALAAQPSVSPADKVLARG